tara:strand:+ start:484 stop:690 length:207 start_codon:yes stop_codon:yes gene_type:complete
MNSSPHLYFVLSSLAVSTVLFLFYIFRPNKTNISNKILLKNLLESLDLELPEELKQLENSTTDPQKYS